MFFVCNLSSGWPASWHVDYCALWRICVHCWFYWWLELYWRAR